MLIAYLFLKERNSINCTDYQSKQLEVYPFKKNNLKKFLLVRYLHIYVVSANYLKPNLFLKLKSECGESLHKHVVRPQQKRFVIFLCHHNKQTDKPTPLQNSIKKNSPSNNHLNLNQKNLTPSSAILFQPNCQATVTGWSNLFLPYIKM